MLNGTQIGGQNIRLSWGRSPSNKQVVVLLYFTHHQGLIYIETNSYDPVMQICSLKLILISGMEVEDTMGMDKGMKIIVMLQLPRTLTCSTVAMAAGMGTTSNQHHSSRRSNKEDICR